MTENLKPVAITENDLPVFCPNTRMPLWSSHPKVFLELNEEGLARCPYCGTRYQLESDGEA
jgi:uncharacterized Zn-finger protein